MGLKPFIERELTRETVEEKCGDHDDCYKEQTTTTLKVFGMLVKRTTTNYDCTPYDSKKNNQGIGFKPKSK